MSLTLAEFFTFDVAKLQTSAFFKAAELTEIGSGQVPLRLVGTAENHKLQVLHERYLPGADTGEELLSHAGEEAGVVTRGNVWVRVGSEERVLGPGDAYYFDSRLPHRFRNQGNEECEIVSAATERSL
jgi:mannose-6-phosphate isomerase-like protein (cupin superfamily)